MDQNLRQVSLPNGDIMLVNKKGVIVGYLVADQMGGFKFWKKSAWKKLGRDIKKGAQVVYNDALKPAEQFLDKTNLISKVGKPLGEILQVVPDPRFKTAGKFVSVGSKVAEQAGYGSRKKRTVKMPVQNAVSSQTGGVKMRVNKRNGPVLF